jgi:hypothetical protein
VFVFVLLSAEVLRFCLTYQTITLNTLFSLQDPFGGITIFPRYGRTHYCLAQQSCEFASPEATFRKDDKVTVVLMGYKPARGNNYLQLFKGTPPCETRWSTWCCLSGTILRQTRLRFPRRCISSAPAATT